MVAIEDMRNSIIAREFGAREDDIQVYITLPASTTITTSVAFPSKDVWIKTDQRFGTIDADVFEVTLIPDGEIAAQDLLMVKNFADESFRCVSGSIIMNKIDVKIVNTDSGAAHTFILVIRGFLIPKTRYEEFMRAIQQVYLPDETINKLADAITKKLRMG